MLDQDFEEIPIAKVDFDHVISPKENYRMVGFLAEKNEMRFLDQSPSKLNQTSGLFKIKPGKGRVTEGDSGGALYRFNNKTGQYDTVVGVACAYTQWLSLFPKDTYFSRLDSEAKYEVRQWLKSNIEAETK